MEQNEETITKTFKKNYWYHSNDESHCVTPRDERAEKITVADVEKKRVTLCGMITQLVQEFERETCHGVNELKLLKSESAQLSTKYVIAKAEIW